MGDTSGKRCPMVQCKISAHCKKLLFWGGAGIFFAQSEVYLHIIFPLLGQLIANQWIYALDGSDVPRPSLPVSPELKCRLIDSLASTFFPLPLGDPRTNRGSWLLMATALGARWDLPASWWGLEGNFQQPLGPLSHQSRWPLPCLGLSFLFYK